ncbi:MFS transporter [Actinoallomurus sp. CA-150999]|uniref:MFS transporter n=1 Tax=Actinoallomurus sp. CA-150999 TaxID=3239887 RepID=UPI003D936E49
MASTLDQQTSAAAGRLSSRRTLLALGGGNAIEWFDWTVYGLLAALMGPHFFPSADPVSATLSALAVFAVGFVARPLGAIILGTLADRVGRRRIMLVSVGSMAVSAVVIAVLPTYQEIGAWAGVILACSRIVQGISTGIEAPLTSTYAVELAPPGKTARFGGILGSYVQLGILGASVVNFVTSAVVGDAAMADWGWRVPFVVGAVAGIGVLWLRRGLPETTHAEPGTGTRDLWAQVGRNKLALLAIVFVVAGAQTFNYAWNVGLPGLARSVYHESPTAIFGVTSLLGVVCSILFMVFGRAADRFRISRTFVAAQLLAVPFVFLMLAYNRPGVVVFAVVMLLGGVSMAFTMALYNVVAATLMPASCRVTGVGLGYAVGVALFGGTAPYLLLWLRKIGAVWAFPAYAAVIFLVSVLLYRIAYRRGSVRVGD